MQHKRTKTIFVNASSFRGKVEGPPRWHCFDMDLPPGASKDGGIGILADPEQSPLRSRRSTLYDYELDDHWREHQIRNSEWEQRADERRNSTQNNPQIDEREARQGAAVRVQSTSEGDQGAANTRRESFSRQRPQDRRRYPTLSESDERFTTNWRTKK